MLHLQFLAACNGAAVKEGADSSVAGLTSKSPALSGTDQSAATLTKQVSPSMLPQKYLQIAFSVDESLLLVQH